jgi:hypothetical protein
MAVQTAPVRIIIARATAGAQEIDLTGNRLWGAKTLLNPNGCV